MAFLCRKSDYDDYERITEGGSDEKYDNSSPLLNECDNRVEATIPESTLQLEDEHRARMIVLSDFSRFAKSEQWKTFVAFLLLNVSFFVTSISLALTHDRLPDRRVYRPLPDVVLDNFKSVDFLLNVSEIQIICHVNLSIGLIFFHRHRFLITKRCFVMLSILYLYRSICFYVTVLPISSETYYCSPRSNASSAWDVLTRAFSLFSGMGLSINNKQTLCGDSIFSGHATILVFTYLVIKEYTPNKLRCLHVLVMLSAITGIVFLLISHSHYTIDVIIAYFVTTRLFWSYHQNCVNTSAANKNSHLAKEWWMFLLNFFENHHPTTSSRVIITNEFEIPWPLNLINSNKV